MNTGREVIALDAPLKTENRRDLNSNNLIGVMVVGGVMTPEEWAAAAKAQQEAITRGD